MNEERIARMRNMLQRELAPTELAIDDESHLHIGHEGAKDGRGHFSVEITSPLFTGASRIERHRLVFEALGDMMKTDIHALRITAKAPRGEDK